MPTEQKRRLGNPGRRPLPVPTVALPPEPRSHPVPDPMRPLGPQGEALWNRVWAVGAAAWISPDTDTELFLVLCEAVDERQALRLKVLIDGYDHERRALRALDSQILTSLSLLGLTPTDRARLGVAEVMAQSTLDKLKERQQQRRAAS